MAEIKIEYGTEQQLKTINAMVQSFADGSIHIDKFLFWVVKNYNVEQSIFLRDYNTKSVNAEILQGGVDAIIARLEKVVAAAREYFKLESSDPISYQQKISTYNKARAAIAELDKAGV